MKLQSALTFSLFVASSCAHAQDDTLQIQQPEQIIVASPGESLTSHKLRIEEASSRFVDRDRLAVPLYGKPDPFRVDRLFVDGWFQWKPDSQFSVKVAGRVGERLTSGVTNPSAFATLREAQVGFRFGDATFLDVGRIVERSGTAFGSNPTDYLKSFSVVDTVAWDPRESRENRLGVGMVRISSIREAWSWSLSYAPRLTSRIPAVSLAPNWRADWDRTNWQQRILGKLTLNLSDDLSPEFLAYRDQFGNSFGFNLATGIGNATTMYVESSLSNRTPLAAEASRFALQSGIFPTQLPLVFMPSAPRRLLADIAAGVVYTLGTRLTVNAEYGYAGRALSLSEWQRWYATGSAAHATPYELAQLWYLRNFASSLQEPLLPHRVLLRADLSNLFDVQRLSLSGYIFTTFPPMSSQYQLALKYAFERGTTLGLYVTRRIGRNNTEFGSTQHRAGVMLSLAHHF